MFAVLSLYLCLYFVNFSGGQTETLMGYLPFLATCIRIVIILFMLLCMFIHEANKALSLLNPLTHHRGRTPHLISIMPTAFSATHDNVTACKWLVVEKSTFPECRIDRYCVYRPIE